MEDFKERAAAALELLPEDMRENAVAYLFEQAEKLRVLEGLVREGLDDAQAGRVSEWNVEDFLHKVQAKERDDK
jgi:hypothetical protein